MNVECVSSWKQFLELIASESFSQPAQVSSYFRGQADASWELKPSLLRNISDIESGRTLELLELEEFLHRQFASQLEVHAGVADIPQKEDILSWWAVMQHYRAPTRLLDWTLSPYVGAYFAVNSHFEKDGAIWVLNSNALLKSQPDAPDIFRMYMSERTKFLRSENEQTFLYIYEPTKKNARMIAQQGVFTVCPDVKTSHEKLLSGEQPTAAGRKITIPANLKKLFLMKLRIMNVTANALFPGLDGLGQSLAELATLEIAWITNEIS